MMTRMWSWLMLPGMLFLSGCPDGGGGLGLVQGSSGTLIYLADQDTPGVSELYFATSGARVTPSLAAGRSITRFAITPDRTAVV